jgi:hypothetical protein
MKYQNLYLYDIFKPRDWRARQDMILHQPSVYVLPEPEV